MWFSHADRKAQSTDLRAAVIRKGNEVRNKGVKMQKQLAAVIRVFFAETEGGRSEEVARMAKKVLQFCRQARCFLKGSLGGGQAREGPKETQVEAEI